MAGSYPLSSRQIDEVIGAPKQIMERIDKTLIKSRGGADDIKLSVDVERIDGESASIQLRASATDRKDPSTYKAVLIVHGQRLRGVDYLPVGCKRGYKIRIPKGWHENVCDPNLPSRDDQDNRHEGLDDFVPTDFLDFLRKVGKMWNIDLWERDQLL